MRSMTDGESTKKPPLIQPAVALGLLDEAGDAVAVAARTAPNRPGGRTAVIVAQLALRAVKRDDRGDVDVATPSP